MFLDSFRQDLRKSRKNVFKVGKSRNFWSKVGHFPKSRKNDSKVGKSRKSRSPLTAWDSFFSSVGRRKNTFPKNVPILN